METKLTIAEILKDKPKGTKLYADAFGELRIEDICTEYMCTEDELGITLSSKDDDKLFFFIMMGKYNRYGEPILFPSKKMRDWSKLAWKKGDVLVSREGSKILFDKWASEDYTKFLGKIKVLGNSYCYDTAYYTLASKKEALEFIKSVEEINNGKLNLETLEIEKQPEFKDGDIITFKDRIIIIYNTSIEKSPKRTEIYYHACLKEGELTVNEYLMSCGFGEGWYSSAEEEKQQIFDALANINKAWDAEKKQIVDLKPKVELKPFDKVLVRDDKSDNWRANFFSHIDKDGWHNCVWAGWTYCIPYEGNEHLLGTNKDVEG